MSTILRQHRSVYGASKIKVELEHLGETVSKRCIRRLMQETGLVSRYAQPSYKTMKTPTNEATYRIVLTYVKAGSDWYYICYLLTCTTAKLWDPAQALEKMPA
ncbi:IS3 family transposase [Planococcus plakortidis]|uniref:IS3 family transposase n=1 Tax=Planococcus plakortidis TaxID=1038856 RepID=UPI0038676A9E